MTDAELLTHLEAIRANQDKTLEAVKSLKPSEINLVDLEAIQKRELEIIIEIETMIERSK